MCATAGLSLPTSLAQEESGSVLFWALILLALLVGMFLVVNYLKKWFRGAQEDLGGGTGFTLADLRALHKSGKMTDEEFELAKHQVVQAVQAATAKAAAAKAAQANRRRPAGVQISQKPDPTLLNPEDPSDDVADKNAP
jgi:hypothetical protein